MAKLILIAGSVILAVLAYSSAPGRYSVGEAVGYGFSPAIFGAALAGLKYGAMKVFGGSPRFVADWLWIWGILLALQYLIVILGHI